MNGRQAQSERPRLIVVMGVAGCGKSTVGRLLAQQLGYQFLEGDEFHTAEARARMAQGQPLDDTLRAPWIAAICDQVKRLAQQQTSCVLAYSGLKKSYRDPLRSLGCDTYFVFLEGDKATIRARMESRQGHFMPSSLLDSQFDTLEPPLDEPNVIRLSVAEPPEQLVASAIAGLQAENARY